MFQIGVHRCKLQEKASNDHQEMQAFRAGRREEEEGTNASILRSDLSEEEKQKVFLKIKLFVCNHYKCFGSKR